MASLDSSIAPSTRLLGVVVLRRDPVGAADHRRHRRLARHAGIAEGRPLVGGVGRVVGERAAGRGDAHGAHDRPSRQSVVPRLASVHRQNDQLPRSRTLTLRPPDPRWKPVIHRSLGITGEPCGTRRRTCAQPVDAAVEKVRRKRTKGRLTCVNTVHEVWIGETLRKFPFTHITPGVGLSPCRQSRTVRVVFNNFGLVTHSHGHLVRSWTLWHCEPYARVDSRR